MVTFPLPAPGQKNATTLCIVIFPLAPQDVGFKAPLLPVGLWGLWLLFGGWDVEFKASTCCPGLQIEDPCLTLGIYGLGPPMVVGMFDSRPYLRVGIKNAGLLVLAGLQRDSAAHRYLHPLSVSPSLLAISPFLGQ